MTRGRVWWPLAALVVLATTAAPVRAVQVDPPLEALHAPGTMLVAGTLLDINPTGRLVFTRGALLSGKQEPPERIDVRVPKDLLATVKRGDHYIFAYTLYVRDPYRPDKVAVDRNGATIVSAPGLEPALFQDNRTTREIINAGRAEVEPHDSTSAEARHETSTSDDRTLLQRLLNALHGKDLALQNLAAHEIALQPDLAADLTSRDRKVLEIFVLDPKSLPSARSALLLAAAHDPKRYGAWWSEAAQAIVASTPIGGYAGPASDPSGLVLTAFELLELHGVKLQQHAVKRWVTSGSPSLAEHALLTLRQQAPAEEKPAIEEALADPALPTATRTFLVDHLRRLNLLNARLRQRKGGSR